MRSVRPASAMLTPDRPPPISATPSATRSAAMLTSTRRARKSGSLTAPTSADSASCLTTCPLLPSPTWLRPSRSAGPFVAYNYGMNVSPYTYAIHYAAHPVREATMTRPSWLPNMQLLTASTKFPWHFFHSAISKFHIFFLNTHFDKMF